MQIERHLAHISRRSQLGAQLPPPRRIAHEQAITQNAAAIFRRPFAADARADRAGIHNLLRQLPRAVRIAPIRSVGTAAESAAAKRCRNQTSVNHKYNTPAATAAAPTIAVE